MGIPSYFSQIIKGYPQIVRSFPHHSKTKFHNLYMDCNSIVYDAIRALNGPVNETKLIQEVIAKIEAYILKIGPSDTVMVAFDGVAPFAKMNQQKTRRYKSSFLAAKSEWSTSNITPGTKFMDELSKQLTNAFTGSETKYKVKQMVVSGSNDIGEGEHKIFQHIRENPKRDQNVLVYGLDSDLIMLTIFHSHLYENGYIFRETPEFIKSCGKPQATSKSHKPHSGKSLPSKTANDEQELSFLDIRLLCQSIQKEMGCDASLTSRVYDYVFLCFMLGNDFLPHFPALNLRTHGMTTLMQTYNQIIGKFPTRYLVDMTTRTIHWNHFSALIKELAKNEHTLLLAEYGVRDKHDKRFWPMKTKEERDFAQLNIPIIYRAEEKYICPNEPLWEERYYKALFHTADKRAIAKNYLEGLEWVFRYYSGNCPDWRWSYEHHYPPLLADLQYYCPTNGTTLIPVCRKAFTPAIQLAYVLPKAQFDLLPEPMRNFLLTNYGEHYSDNLEFQWAFCRYFWEAHINFMHISVDELDNWR